MATLEQDEANILDAESINWRLIVYPLLLILIVVVGYFGWTYYQDTQRNDAEAAARAQFRKAKTPEEWIKVADQYPNTTNGVLSLMAAATYSFDKQDYTSAISDYQRITKTDGLDPNVRDSALIGLASAQEAGGKSEDAINTYLEVAHRGSKSPYAPFAYSAAARLYEEAGKVENQREMLNLLATLDPDSQFVREGQMKLKEMNAAATPVTPPSVATSVNAPQVTELPATPAPANPTPVTATPAASKPAGK